MANIRDLPDEVLLIIFKKLYYLTPCQKVCRAWYSLAHPLVLRKIQISNGRVEKFTKAIDYNPKTTYLNAVRELDVYAYNADRLDKEIIKKLFFRFPNLENVKMHATLDDVKDFDDEICKDLLVHCPKLDEFEVEVGWYCESYFSDLMYKLRFLVTTIDMKKRGYDGGIYGSDLRFLSNFPRIKRILNSDLEVENIQSFLPTLTKLPRLTTFQLVCREDDQEGFAEKFVTTEQLIMHLSAVENMTLSLNGFALNSIKFVSKYLTGLNTIRINSWFQANDETQRLVFDHILNFIQSENKCHFEISIPLDVLIEYLTVSAHKLYIDTVSTEERILQINTNHRIMVVDPSDIAIPSRFIITAEPSKRHIIIRVPTYTDLHDLATKLFNQTTLLHNVDKFILEIPKTQQRSSYSLQKGTPDIYKDMLLNMPMLKEIELSLPAFYEVGSCFWHPLTRVDKLIIRASNSENFQPSLLNSYCVRSSDEKFQLLLDNYSVIFPNVKDLFLDNFCGHWKKYSGEFQVDLGNYTLFSLTLDYTAVDRMMKNIQQSYPRSIDKFVVFEVTLISIGERWLYKVAYNNRNVVRVQDTDLKGLVRGKDYLGVHITVSSLERLHICVQNYNYKEDEDVDDMYVCVSNTRHQNHLAVFDTTGRMDKFGFPLSNFSYPIFA